MRLTNQVGSGGKNGTKDKIVPRCGSAGWKDSREKSYDTLGTIPRIEPDTAAATPENMEAYLTRSSAEVGCPVLLAVCLWQGVSE